jgi:hypothetical protein
MCFIFDRIPTEGTVEYRFKSDEWRDLTPAQKVQRCRTMAKEARALADAAPPDLAPSYLRLAEDWQMLALDIERTTNSTS